MERDNRLERRQAYNEYVRLFWALAALPADDPASADLRRAVAAAEARWRGSLAPTDQSGGATGPPTAPEDTSPINH